MPCKLKNSRYFDAHGFTLIEILVVIAIVGIITMIATPSFRSMLVSNEIRSAVNDWTLALQTARSEAVRQRARVTVCPSSDGSTCKSSSSYDIGWIVGVEKNDGSGDLSKVLQDFPPPSRVTMTTNLSIGQKGKITYLANGLPVPGFFGFTMTVTEKSASPPANLTRYICVAKTGRPRVFNKAQYLALPGGGC